jgi:hypothetical protein
MKPGVGGHTNASIPGLTVKAANGNTRGKIAGPLP